MKKIYYFLFIIFASFILLSCNNKNVERSLLNCRFVNAGLDDFDSVVFAESEDSIKTYLKGMEEYEEYNEISDGYIVDESQNVANFACFTGVISNNSFDIYVITECLKTNVKEVELEVNNDVIINDIECKKGELYKIDVTGKKNYFILSLNVSNDVTIKILSLKDNEDNLYDVTNVVNGRKRTNEIEIISLIDMVTFDESYSSFRINDNPNIKITSIQYNENRNIELKDNYVFNIGDIYYIDYTFTIKGVDIKCHRAYTKSENEVYHSGCCSYTIIHKFE